LPRAVITLIANTLPDPFCTPRYTAPYALPASQHCQCVCVCGVACVAESVRWRGGACVCVCGAIRTEYPVPSLELSSNASPDQLSSLSTWTLWRMLVGSPTGEPSSVLFRVKLRFDFCGCVWCERVVCAVSVVCHVSVCCRVCWLILRRSAQSGPYE
jgi:hypothetical protein